MAGRLARGKRSARLSKSDPKLAKNAPLAGAFFSPFKSIVPAPVWACTERLRDPLAHAALQYPRRKRLNDPFCTETIRANTYGSGSAA
jgi:hypothetical protein